MNVIIIDDDEPMLMIMQKMLSGILDIEVVGCFQSPHAAYTYILKNKVDMAFVDIVMPEESGIDFVNRVLTYNEDIAIFFLTAHKEYALEAFEVHAFDYLVKPVSRPKLVDTIQSAKKRLVFLHNQIETKDKSKLVVKCFGNMEVKDSSGQTVRFTSSKSSELMAYLILKKGRLVSKWSIMEDIFPGMAPQNAETYLNTTVYKLRKALEPHGMRNAVISTEESYKIDLADIWVDVIDFENRLETAADFNDINLEEYLKIERLYTGDLFGERDYDWCMSEKERMLEVYLCFARKLGFYLLNNQQLLSALQIAKKIVGMNELDEENNILLMQIYATQRNIELLERQYRRYEKALRNELGIVPDKKVVNLYTSLRNDYLL